MKTRLKLFTLTLAVAIPSATFVVVSCATQPVTESATITESPAVDSLIEGAPASGPVEDTPPPVAPPEPAPAASREVQDVPASVHLNPALKGVIRLLRAGVEDEVLMAYIQNSQNTFNVGSEEIVYLTDLGMPGPVLKAMIERDAEIQGKPVATETAQLWESQVAEEPTDANAASADAANEEEVIVTSAPAEPVTVDYFYDYLSPYGTWVDIPGYGRCWQPAVAVSTPGWKPYGDRGRWLSTDDGWYWYSDYSWGWAPFHYGRWLHNTRWGWCWAPGTVWGPSWVTWSYYDDYCGWAPLPPYSGSGFYFSVGVSWGIPYWGYTYVPCSRVWDRHPYRCAVPYSRARDIHRHAVVCDDYRVGRNHAFVNHGISPAKIRSLTGVEARRARVHVTAERTASRTREEWLERDGRRMIGAHLQRTSFEQHQVSRQEERSNRRVPSQNSLGASSVTTTPASRRTVNSTRNADALILRGERSGQTISPAARTVVRPKPGAVTVSPIRRTPTSSATRSSVPSQRSTRVVQPAPQNADSTRRTGNQSRSQVVIRQPKRNEVPTATRPANVWRPPTVNQNSSVRSTRSAPPVRRVEPSNTRNRNTWSPPTRSTPSANVRRTPSLAPTTRSPSAVTRTAPQESVRRSRPSQPVTRPSSPPTRSAPSVSRPSVRPSPPATRSAPSLNRPSSATPAPSRSQPSRSLAPTTPRSSPGNSGQPSRNERSSRRSR